MSGHNNYRHLGEDFPPEMESVSITTESVFRDFYSVVFKDLVNAPPTAKENVNLTAINLKMAAYKANRISRDIPTQSPLATHLSYTPDLLATAVGGVWCWAMFLVLVYRGLCIKSRKVSSGPSTFLIGHAIRILILVALLVVQIAACGEAGLRYWRSQEPYILLIPAATITLLTTLLASFYYHAIEKWRAPGYIWICVGIWASAVGLGILRMCQVILSGIKIALVYPCISLISSILSLLLLGLDLYTAMIWTWRRRHCEVLEITPGSDDIGSALGSSAGVGGKAGVGGVRGNKPSNGAAGTNNDASVGGVGNSATYGGITYAHPGCSFLSRATFLWFLQILRLGWKRPLEFTDLGRLPREEESSYQYERFSRCYNVQQLKSLITNASKEQDVSLWKVFYLVYWKEMVAGGLLKFLGDTVNYVGPLAISAIVTYVSRIQSGDPSVAQGELVNGDYYASWGEAITNGWVVACLALIASLAQSTFSQASTHLVAMEGIHVKAALQAMVYHKSLRLSTCSKEINTSIADNQDDDKQDSESSSSSSSSSSSNTAGHAGTVINLSSEDADNIMTFFMHCHYIWAIPLKISVIVILLWYQLGMAAVIAVVVGIFFLTPLQFCLCKKIAAVNKSFLSVSDERLRQTHELVTSVKLIKLHAWEDVFVKRITQVREKELGLLHQDSILRAIMTFLTQSSGVLVSLVTFGLYSLLEGVALEPSRVFSGLALFQQLTVPLFILPIIVSHTIRAKNSTQRLKEFFNSPEVEGPKTPNTPINLKNHRRKLSYNKQPKFKRTPRNVKEGKIFSGPKFTPLGDLCEESRPTSTYSNLSTESSWSYDMKEIRRKSSISSLDGHSDSEEDRNLERWKKRRSVLESEGYGTAVTIQNGTFSWDDKKKLPVLENISMTIPTGGLTVIVGNVGCGKTSMLQALLGEMITIQGQLRWNGEMSVAYVSQHPWLLNATLKDNILFGRRLLTKRYQRVLQACALKPDIDILPAGDQTEIGERGINLSGGQRQRVAIARALYSDARTILLDCPFSALDTGVTGQVWEEGVVQLLLCRRRTVILTTHLTHLTRHADKVIYLDGGHIVHQGSPRELALTVPKLWSEWSSEKTIGSTGISRKGRHEGRTARERWKLLRTVTRISIQRASMSRASRRERTEESQESIYYCSNNSSPLKHYNSLNRRHLSHHNALLPGDECEFLPSLTPPLSRHNSHNNYNSLQSSKKSLFSNRPNKQPSSTSTSDKWHLGRILTSNAMGEEDLEEDLELEEEALPLDDDIEEGKLVSEEERERGIISKWNYVVYMRACGIALCLSYLFCALAGQGVSVLLDFWLERWSDEASTSNITLNHELVMEDHSLEPKNRNIMFIEAANTPEQYDTFVSKTMFDHYPIYAALSVASITLALSTNLLGQVAAGKGRRKIHQDMLQNIVRCSVRFFDVTPAGRIMNRFTTDTAMIDKELARSVTHLLFFVLLVTSAIIVNAIVTPAFLAVAIPICAIYYAIQKFFRCSSRELKRLESLSRSPLYSHMSESVSGAMVIRAYGDQQRFTDILFHRLDTHVVAFTLLHAGNRWLGISLDYIGSIIVFLATFASLLWSTVIGQELSPARVGLAISYTLLVPVYLNWVVRFMADTEMCLNAVERIQQYATLPAEENPNYHSKSITPGNCYVVSNGISTISYRSNRSSTSSRSSGLPLGWPLEGRVQFQDVTLTYDTTLEPVLTGLNFNIQAGEKVGLCGRTGSGKSSLILSLYRLVECAKGKILLDGTDIQQVPLALLRGSISVIPQDTHLFGGTVRFNLDPLEQRSDANLWEALEIAQLKPLISSMPAGLDSEIAEGGSNFSAGQRQLFCIARAILRRSSLIIFDEATSALDASTERALRHTLNSAFSHATIITIAHGVNSLLEYPRILVLENGKLVEDGNPRVLAKTENGVFANLLMAANENKDSQ